MRRRIDMHRNQRPAEWDTLEEPLALAPALGTALEGYDICLLDCLTIWISNMLLAREGDPDPEMEILAAASELLEVYERSSATWIVVSNEVGLSVVPASSLGADVPGRSGAGQPDVCVTRRQGLPAGRGVGIGPEGAGSCSIHEARNLATLRHAPPSQPSH